MGLTCLGHCRFRPTCRRRVGPRTVRPRRVEASQGGGPNLEKVGAPRLGPVRWAPTRKGGAPKGGRPEISRFFFPLPPQFSFFSLCGPSVEFWWCLKRRCPEMCTFGLSGCRVKPRRPQSRRRGFSDRPRAQTCTFQARVLQTPPKFHEKTLGETHKKQNGGGRGKKSAKFWGPHPSGPSPFGSPPFGGEGEGDWG